jgi:hypothetical protein
MSVRKHDFERRAREQHCGALPALQRTRTARQPAARASSSTHPKRTAPSIMCRSSIRAPRRSGNGSACDRRCAAVRARCVCRRQKPRVSRSLPVRITKRAAELVPPDELARARARHVRKE